jgi:RNase P subunit RPR2
MSQAKKVHATDPQLSSRYVATAEYRRQICRNCNSLLVHGENCRVRVRQRREPHVVVTCLNCGFQTRMPLRKKKENTSIE